MEHTMNTGIVNKAPQEAPSAVVWYAEVHTGGQWVTAYGKNRDTAITALIHKLVDIIDHGVGTP
jgi:hypothetical protein